jgi:hypothetical protein
MDFAKIPAAAAAMEQQQRILLSKFRTRNGYQYDIIGSILRLVGNGIAN